MRDMQLSPIDATRLYDTTSAADFANHLWQDKNSIIRFHQLQALLSGRVREGVLDDIRAGLDKVGMSIRLTPYVLSMIDWTTPGADPIRRQFLPMASELEEDHPGLSLDSLSEQHTSPVPGLVHRYPDKVLFLATSVCPVYCQYCTRSYAVGQDTPVVQKENVTSAQNWDGAFGYIRSKRQIEDVVISGGDIARLKPQNVRHIGNRLLEIDHVRRLRFATKAISVQPMKVLTDDAWFSALVDVVKRGRKLFKDVCLHTHFNHPREITPSVEAAMHRLHSEGVHVRNQAVLLRGVNDDPQTLIELVRGLGRVNIHPYYVYLCDMVTGCEHFRLPLATARRLEREVRGTTAGFNTPLFVVDLPGGGGKRDVHSVEFLDSHLGVTGFRSPAVDRDRIYYYFDPLRSLTADARTEWRRPETRKQFVARLQQMPLAAE